ncbi:MAG: transporter substrate-binding domain-containing protein [Alphaproteobacteria bacterium]|nr:transporter substrate-binding domain-containing protein [Alphaproteobacteria bacterium]
MRVIFLLALLLLCACDAPRDPEHATDRILASHLLHAGASENPPWIWFDHGQPRGPDAELVTRLAASLGARVDWQRGSESRLMPLLEKRKLDVVAGGFTSSTPWGSTVGTTRPYGGHVLLTAPGENQLLLRLDRFLVTRQ